MAKPDYSYQSISRAQFARHWEKFRIAVAVLAALLLMTCDY